MHAPTLVQSLNVNPCVHFQLYITSGPKILTYNHMWVHQTKNQIQQWSDSNLQLSSHFPLDYIDSSENFSNSVFYLAEKWMRDTVVLSFETENWMWLLRHYLNFLCELNFIGQ